MFLYRYLIPLGVLIGVAMPLSAEDWPQWLGPRRDSVWRETGIVDRLPADGLKVKWRAPVSWGYGGPAVSQGRVFVMDYEKRSGDINNNPGGRDELEGSERILCLDATTGKALWTHQYDQPYQISYGGGPRCTPTVDGDRVYALGAEGKLWCLESASGKVIWSKDFKAEYNAPTPFWGVAAHPLVDGDTLYCLVGGEGSVAVAFHKHTGQELWRSLSCRDQGYCPPTLIEHEGRKLLIIWHSEAVNALEPTTGKVLWSAPAKPNYGMSITTPRQSGPYLLVTGYGNAGGLLRLGAGDSAPELVWGGNPRSGIYCCNAPPLIEDGTIYGSDLETGNFMGVRLETGERLWETSTPTHGGDRRARYATAFLVKHEDHFFLFSELGDLILANLSPQGYEELGRAHVLDPTNNTFGRRVVWSHPAFANRSLYARNDKELVCVDLAK